MEYTITGAALLALILLAALKLDTWRYVFGDWAPHKGLLLMWDGFRLLFRDLALSDLGVVVVTYCHPILGAPTTTAPTGAQAAQVSEMAAQVFFADTDTAAIITHNWGLPNSFPSWLWPQVFFNKSLGATGDPSFATSFTFGLTNTNSVTMTKGLGAGSGGTYNVYLCRPHSLVR